MALRLRAAQTGTRKGAAAGRACMTKSSTAAWITGWLALSSTSTMMKQNFLLSTTSSQKKYGS